MIQKRYTEEHTEADILLPWISIDFQVKFRRPKMGTAANIKKTHHSNWKCKLMARAVEFGTKQRLHSIILLQYCATGCSLYQFSMRFSNWDCHSSRQSAIQSSAGENQDGKSPAVKATRKFPKWYIDCQWNSVLRVEKKYHSVVDDWTHIWIMNLCYFSFARSLFYFFISISSGGIVYWIYDQTPFFNIISLICKLYPSFSTSILEVYSFFYSHVDGLCRSVYCIERKKLIALGEKNQAKNNTEYHHFTSLPMWNERKHKYYIVFHNALQPNEYST